MRYTRPPASATSWSSPSSSGQRPRPRAGTSSASVQPRIGNAEHSPALVLEAFQHREERRASLRAEAFERGAHDALRPVRHDELVLHEPVRAVDAVPSGDGVERVEEAGDALDLVLAAPRRLAEPDLVEGSDRQRVEQTVRATTAVRGAGPRGENCRGARAVRLGHLVEARVIAACEHRSSELLATRETVDPRDRVPVAVVALEHARHAVVDVGRAFGVDVDVRGLDRLELERRLGHDAGQAHAARGRPEGVVVGRDGERARARAWRSSCVPPNRRTTRGGTCRGCRTRWRRRRSRAGCPGPPSGTSRAAGTPAAASRGSRPPRSCRCPSRRRPPGCGRGRCTARPPRRRSAPRRRSCDRARAPRSRRARAAASRATRSTTSLGAARLPHVGAARRGAAPAGQDLAVRGDVDHGQPACTATAKHTTQSAPMPMRTGSESTSSSGALPSPCARSRA